jgi:hypothetical protein
MQPETRLVRDHRDRSLAPGLFVPEERPTHRPRLRYRAHIDSEEDVKEARRAGLHLSLFDSATAARLGYPLEFKPRLLVAKDVAPAVDTRFKTISFSDPLAAGAPQLEDYIVAMLQVDPLGARRIARDNRKAINQVELLRKIFREGVEARAYRVRLDDFAPGLPKVGEPIPRVGLTAEDRRDFGRLPQ